MNRACLPAVRAECTETGWRKAQPEDCLKNKSLQKSSLSKLSGPVERQLPIRISDTVSRQVRASVIKVNTSFRTWVANGSLLAARLSTPELKSCDFRARTAEVHFAHYFVRTCHDVVEVARDSFVMKVAKAKFGEQGASDNRHVGTSYVCVFVLGPSCMGLCCNALSRIPQA